MKLNKALHIGINYTGTSHKLNGCINDAENLNAFIKTQMDCSSTEFKILTDKLGTPTSNMPTRSNIVSAIKWLIEDAKPDSILFMSYSGHGSWVKDKNGDEIDGRDEVICCLDGDIIDDDLNMMIVEKLPKGSKLYAIFDCCHSHTVLDLKYSYKIDRKYGQTEYKIVPDGHYKDKESKIICISGCLDNDYSSDAYIDGKFAGALTYAFMKTIKTMQLQGKPLKYKDIMKNLLVYMKGNGFDQKPQLTTCFWLNLDDVMW